MHGDQLGELVCGYWGLNNKIKVFDIKLILPSHNNELVKEDKNRPLIRLGLQLLQKFQLVEISEILINEQTV